MNIRSLRFRLTFWNIAAFLAVTMLIFLGFYIVTRKILSIHTDNLLMAHSLGVVNLIRDNNIGMHSMLTQEAFAREFNEIPGMLVVAMDSQGQIFNASITMNRDAAIFGDLFARVYQKHEQFFANKNIGGSLMRFLATPIVDQGDNLLGVVLVAHPIDVIQKSLDTLLIVLGGTFLVLIVPVSWGGYLLVQKAVEPIVSMSDKLKKIGSKNLNERITNPQTGDELEELSGTFNLLLDRLHLAFTRERQFIEDVAHELKTPLSTIKGGAEIALAHPRTSSEYQKTLQEILVDTNILSATLKNVLDLAWSESQVVDQSFEAVNLSLVLEDLRDIAVKLAIPKHISISCRIDPGIMVLGKADKLARAILNLIDNAVKFTPTKGKIFLNLEVRDKLARIQVKDSGSGIKPSDLPHIFERFYRGSKSSKTFGSGLGLAIAMSIVRAHRGEIKVESEIGKGSTFSIFLPLIKSS